VLVVDDDASVVEGLGVVLRGEPYTVLTATSARQALDLLERQSVDVIVTDETMPGMRGSELLALARKLRPETMRLVLTGQATLHSAIRSINEAAVHRYLIKPCPPAELKAAITEALQAKARQSVHARLVEAARQQSRLLAEESMLSGVRPGAGETSGFSEEALRTLSLREREVLDLLAQGHRVSQIAKSLFISGHTVRNHLKAIFRKLDVHSQVEIIQRARG
jgi:two-component system probable response regulator PhcQ